MANVKGYLKDGSGNILQPGTDASMVYMQDSAGQDSTVQAELAGVRTTVTGLAGLDGMNIKGTVNGTTATLPASGYAKGDAYIVGVAGTYAGNVCEVGDWIVCIAVSSPAANSDWSVIQANLDAAVAGPASATDAHIAVFDGTSGKALKDTGFTIATSVPANAVFTDTTYSDMTGADGSAAGAAGLVPAPTASDNVKFLKGDGTWGVPTDTDTHYTAELVVGASDSATADASTANATTFINTVENSGVSGSIQVTGSGSVSVAAASGVITVTGTCGIPVVNNGASAPSNLADGAVYFEKAASA